MLGNFNFGMALNLVKEPSNTQVVLMGIGTVFVGLICIIIICKIMGSIIMAGTKKAETKVVESPAAPVAKPQNNVIENREEIIAAVSAVAAEELGTDISAIRIHSFKKL